MEDGFAFFNRRPEEEDRVILSLLEARCSHDRVEIIFDKDHVGCFFAHVRSRLTHGDTNIGCFQSHSIIHSITRHADDVSLRLQGLAGHLKRSFSLPLQSEAYLDDG